MKLISFLCFVLVQGSDFASASLNSPNVDISTCFPSVSLSTPETLVEASRKPCVAQWLQDMSQETDRHLSSLSIRDELRKRRNAISDYSYKILLREGELNIQFRNEGLFLINENGDESSLLENKSYPKNMSPSGFLLSPDAKKIALAFAPRGSDIKYWSIFELDSKRFHAEQVFAVRWRSLKWSSDSKGIFYSKWPTRDIEEKLLGTSQARNVPIHYQEIGRTETDVKVFENPDYEPAAMFSIDGSMDDEVMVAFRIAGPEMPLSVMLGVKKNDGSREWKPFVKPSGKIAVRGYYLNRRGDYIYQHSRECGSEGCYVRQNIKTGEKSIVVPLDKDYNLNTVFTFPNLLMFRYIEKATQKIQIRFFDLEGNQRSIFEAGQKYGTHPNSWIDLGYDYFYGRDLFLSVSSPSTGTRYFKYDTVTNEIIAIEPTNGSAVAPFAKKVQTKLLWVKNDQGQGIPVYETSRTDTVSAKFAYIDIYASIGYAEVPSFDSMNFVLLEMGGVVYHAAPRGAGNLGFDWTFDGNSKKLPTIDDVASISKYVQELRPELKNRVVFSGGSWGGYLSLQLFNRYHNLFAGFIASVPVVNTESFFRSYAGWFFKEDVFIERDSNGHLVGEAEKRDEMSRISPERLDLVEQITSPLFIQVSRNDERIGPEQNALMQRAIFEKFGANVPVFTFASPDLGHAASRDDELSFIGKLFQTTELVPLDH